jgi:hypothetical protein
MRRRRVGTTAQHTVCIVRLTGRLLDMTGAGCTAVTCLTILIEMTALWVRNDITDWEAESE